MTRSRTALASAAMLFLASLAAACDSTSPVSPRSQVSAPQPGVSKRLVSWCGTSPRICSIAQGDTVVLQIGKSEPVWLYLGDYVCPVNPLREVDYPGGTTGVSMTPGADVCNWYINADSSAGAGVTPIEMIYQAGQGWGSFSFVVRAVLPPPPTINRGQTFTFTPSIVNTTDVISLSQFASGLAGDQLTVVSATVVGTQFPGVTVGATSDHGGIFVTAPAWEPLLEIPVQIQVTVADGRVQTTGIITVNLLY